MNSKVIKKILEDHSLWLKSNRAKGKRAELLAVEFIGANLQGVQLQRAMLMKVNLQKANLKGANLLGADLQRANLEGADLEGANLKRAILIHANLQKANLKNADFEGANLEKASLYDANLDNTNLKDARFTNAYIDKATASYLPQSVIEKYGNTFFDGWPFFIDNGDLIIRSIEFPPEYHQAGISILNYFGTVLRKKYPDQTVKVKIEQQGLKVTLTIDPLEGDREVIEKALDEYGLVVTGQISLDQYTDDKILIMELKQELRMAQVRLETYKELTQYQKADIEELRRIVFEAVKKPPTPITLNVPVTINITQQISLIYGNLNELLKQLQTSSKEAKTIQDLQDSLNQIDQGKSREEVAKSSGMSKFRRFLEDVEKAETIAGNVIKTTRNGIDIARRLAGYYNDIAQWCGLPQVPKPFTKV